MRFDHTNGKEARYMVSVYSWRICDQYIYHTYKEAKLKYDELKDESLEQYTVISVYDMSKDIRKHYMMF